MNKGLLVKTIQDSIVEHYFQLLHVLIVDVNQYSPEIVLTYYTTLIEFLNFSEMSVVTQTALVRLLLAVLIHVVSQKIALSIDCINHSIQLITKSLAEVNLQCEELRSVEYYFLLKLFKYFFYPHFTVVSTQPPRVHRTSPIST